MKKRMTLIVALCCVIGAGGCSLSASTASDDTETGGLQADSLTVETEEESPQGESSIVASEELADIKEFSGELDFSYVSETDAQSDNRMCPSSAVAGDGYYQLGGGEEELNARGNFLRFYDNASGQMVMVCSKSNCSHTGEGCDAYFFDEEYPMPEIASYEGNLYLLELEEDYLYLCKVSADGTTREKKCMLMRLRSETTINEDGTENESFYYPSWTLHRGYVYFTTSYPGFETVELYRVAIEGGEEPELLEKISGHFPNIYRIKPYGRYVLFQMGNFDKNYENFQGAIYAYDTESGEITLFCENCIREFTIYKNNLYYEDLEENIWKKDLETGETSVFFETTEVLPEDVFNIFPWGDYLVVQVDSFEGDSWVQYAVDESGTLAEQKSSEEGDEKWVPYME